ncbi:restriction endonuclease subunit S [Rheinheimera baltica]|uniref:Restriction endonuclease subunit S n=1 Tax=Rheinheimera baltica TaxID=67576 RepID=A0ABT9I6D1_9GAMM|nr:restriction endonuclease subunit S [Rheinheimera baltica]MDP5138585.1 restriction endonuclease subunit S [Rheinheimera baltica]MDP5149931.1 restriction endonuclease subunit S [Rheinheimera baltica]
MSSETGFIPLRNVSLRITKGTTPTKEQGFKEKGINYIKSECITPDGNIDTSKFTHIDIETHKKLARSQLVEGNVLFSMAGIYLGKSAVVLSEHLPANTNQAVGIITLDREKADPYFVHYAIQSPATRSWVLRSAAQSAQPNFNLQEIGDLKIPALSLKSQKEIAGVLKNLDDRIALLRETNATLEAIAQALFKSWFVDFDPVHANAGTQAPSLPAEIQALFPSRLVESPQGLIPEGWEVGAIKRCCERVESGGTPKRSVATYWDGDVSWLSSGEVRNAIVLDTKEKITALGVAESSAKLWPAGTTVVAMYGATAGEVCILAKPSTANQACCGLIPKTHTKSFVFFCIRREREKLASKSSGSAQQNLNKGLVESHEIVIPPKQVLAEFENSIGSMLEGWIENEKKAETLANLRDTLLPRLISGQLRLPEAEAALAEVI